MSSLSQMKIGRRTWTMGLVGAAGVALGLGLSVELGLGHAAAASPGQVPAPQVAPATPPTGPGVSFVRLAKEVGPAVVNINVKIARQATDMGEFFNPFSPFGGGAGQPY